jgi:hypothetical protein
MAFMAIAAASPAQGGEADDLQNMINRARQGASDLDRLDERGAVKDETARLRVWLDEAWKLRSEQRYDETRMVLDRCDIQAEMVRHKILASQLAGEASEKEAALKQTRANVEKLKRSIAAAQAQRAALEAKSR